MEINLKLFMKSAMHDGRSVQLLARTDFSKRVLSTAFLLPRFVFNLIYFHRVVIFIENLTKPSESEGFFHKMVLHFRNNISDNIFVLMCFCGLFGC